MALTVNGTIKWSFALTKNVEGMLPFYVFLTSSCSITRVCHTLFLNILTFSLEEQSAYFVYVNAIITTKKFKI